MIENWNNDVPLNEQTADCHDWYQTEIAPLLSFNVPIELKRAYLKENGIKGEPFAEPETPGVKPCEIDKFCRPVKWAFGYAGYKIEVIYEYFAPETAWRLNLVHVKIYKK